MQHRDDPRSTRFAARRSSLSALLALSAVTLPARADDVATAPVVETRQPLHDVDTAREVCVTDEERAIAAAARRRDAFSTTAVPLGPFYWATADRTLTQAMLVYWRVLDLDEGSRLTLVAPLFAESCTPRATTSVGLLGLLAWRDDDEGRAGYVGPYFTRRDRFSETTALAGVFLSSTESLPGGGTRDLFVLGPAYRLTSRGERLTGVFPFVARYQDDQGRTADLFLPLAFRFGDDEADTFFVGQTFGRREKDGGFFVHSLGLAHVASSADGRDRTISIPLLATHISDDFDGSNVSRLRIVGPTYFNDNGNGEVTFVSPLYLRQRSRHGLDVDLAPPLLAARLALDDASASVVGPVYAFDFGDARARGVLGLVHDGAVPALWLASFLLPAPLDAMLEPGTEARIVPPLLFARFENDTSRAAFLGPAYRIATDESAHAGLLPLGVAGGTKEGARYLVVPPLALVHLVDDDARTFIAGPVYRFTDGPRDHVGVVGLFSSRNAPGDHAFIAPGFARFADAANLGEGTRETVVVLQTYSERTPEGRLLVSAPFYVEAHDDVTGDFVRLAPPLLAADWRAGGVRRKVLPLYTDVEDESGIDQLFFPFVLTGRAKPGKDTTPLLSTIEREALTPLVGKQDAHALAGGGDRAYVVAPLLLTAHVRDHDTAFTLVGQTYALASEDGAFHVGSAPFYFGGATSGGARYHLVPPLLSGFVVDEEGNATVTMAYYRLESATRVDHGLAPLYFAGHDRAGHGYTIAPPLGFAHHVDTHGQKLAAGPFFFVDDDRVGRHHALLPLYLSSSWSDGHLFVAPGVVRAGDDETDTLVTPFAIAQKTSDDTGTFLSPLYVRHTEPDAQLDAMPGAFRFVEDDAAITAVGPVFDARLGEDHARGVAPFYVEVENPSFALTATPLFAHARAGDDTTLVTPLFIDRTEAGARTTLAPFVARFADDDETHLLVAQTKLTLTRNGWHLWSVPFYVGGRDRATNSEHHVVPLLATAYFGQLTPEDDDERDFALLVGPAFRARSAIGQETALAPIVFTGVGRDTPLRPYVHEAVSGVLGEKLAEPLARGDAAYTVVPPLFFAHLRSDDGRAQTTLVGQTLHHESPGHTLLHSAPFYFGETTREGSSHLVPLLLSGTGEDAVRGASTTVVAPLAYAHTKDRSSETRLVGPWFTHDDDDGHSMRALAPLYVDVENDDGFFRMLSPLLFSWGDDETTTLAAPGLLARRTQVGHETVAFPAFVDVQHETLSLRVLGGLLWSASSTIDGEKRALDLAPGYVRYEDDDETIEVAGVVAWSRGKGESEAWSWHVQPFVSVWSHRPGHLRVHGALGVVGYEHEGDRRQVSVLGVPLAL